MIGMIVLGCFGIYVCSIVTGIALLHGIASYLERKF